VCGQIEVAQIRQQQLVQHLGHVQVDHVGLATLLGVAAFQRLEHAIPRRAHVLRRAGQMLAGHGQEAGLVAAVDLDADVVVHPVGRHLAAHHHPQAGTGWADLGVAVQLGHHVERPGRHYAALDAVVQVDAGDAVRAGHHVADAGELLRVAAEGGQRGLVAEPLLRLGRADAVLRPVGAVRHLVVFLFLGIPHGAPGRPAALLAQRLRNGGPVERANCGFLCWRHLVQSLLDPVLVDAGNTRRQLRPLLEEAAAFLAGRLRVLHFDLCRVHHHLGQVADHFGPVDVDLPVSSRPR
jgi:hypothetical protein